MSIISSSGNKRVYSNGMVIIGGVSEETNDPSPTQLDRIKAAVATKNEDIANSAVDAYTLELIEKGLL